MARIVLAMSGGVDSSVAAHLLLEAGHDVVGVFMRHGEQSPAACSTDSESSGSQLPIVSRLDHQQGCCTAADAEDARRVSDRMGIPFYALDLNQEFGRIMDYFVQEYARGRTPNPCVQCNNWIKFGKLFDYADSIGAEFVATGHYARLEKRDDNSVALLRGVDRSKDQSYVLAGIGRDLLPRMMLPVGGFEKTKIRELAAHVGLDVANKRDSQEICFVTQGRYDAFVRSRLEQDNQADNRAGELITTDGRVVGEHAGIEGFTIGQRKGLGVALGEPVFVIRIEPDTRRVVLGSREELDQPSLTASEVNWLVKPPAIASSFDCWAQVRYNSPPSEALLTRTDETSVAIRFKTPQTGVTPGQAVVAYSIDEPERAIAGGWID